MDREKIKHFIAARVARELSDGDVVNLGIGMPTLVPRYLPEGVEVVLYSDNGIIGAVAVASPGDAEPRYVIDAGGEPSAVMPGGAFTDSAMSFAIARGGHIDVTVLGALEVDERGNLANWIIPGRLVPGMGGAMDLVAGAKRVIIAMEHTAKGRHKIVKECTLPLTAVGRVDLIVTEMGLMAVTPDGIELREINPEYTVGEVREATGATLIISPNLKHMG